MKKIILISILMAGINLLANAQVGINTQDPDPSAALHIDGGKTKGLLIPIINTDDRKIVNAPADGLLVYDEERKVFYFFNGTDWIALNPLQASEDNLNTLVLPNSINGTPSITFANNVVVAANRNLTANGTTTLGGTVRVNEISAITDGSSVTINSALTTKGNIDAESNNIRAGSVNVGSTEITSTKVKADTVNATAGFGITPLGGIIMWSGNKESVPKGWALCDGGESNGYKTPDLRGRFIVGYGENASDNGSGSVPTTVWDNNYNAPGNLSTEGTNTGSAYGQKEVTLTLPQIPSHNHPITDIKGSTSAYGSDRKIWQSGQDGSNASSISNWFTDDRGGNASGQTVPHENRPPYYVLAFIMRVQ